MAAAGLTQIRIVLVEPAGPLNVGSVARVMKNMGLERLVLVLPACDPLSDLARQMAVHAQDVLGAAQTVASLPEALVGCQRAIATTGRPPDHPSPLPLELPEAVLPWLLPRPPAPDFQSALIFGPEDRGLSNTELNFAQRYLRIPTSDDYPSLNLAQAVALCCYELRRIAQGELGRGLTGAIAPPRDGSSPVAEAPLDQIEGFYQQLETLLLQIGYLYPHTAASRMEKFRRLLHRAAPSQQELAMLRGILSQVDWALAARPPQR